MNLINEISPEEIGCFFAEDFPAMLIALSVVADWHQKVGVGSYDEYMISDEAKIMSLKFAQYLKMRDQRSKIRIYNFLKSIVEEYENE